MNFRFTLILLVVAIVAIAGFGIAQKQLPPSATPTPTPANLLSVNSADVTGIDVRAQGKETSLTKDNNEQWHLVKPVQTPNVDQTKVSDLVNQLVTLNTASPVAAASVNLDPYGLKTPQATIVLQETNNRSDTLLVGNPTMDANNYYVLRQGSSSVQLMTKTLVDSVIGLATTPPEATPTPTPTVTPTPAASGTPAPSASA